MTAIGGGDTMRSVFPIVLSSLWLMLSFAGCAGCQEQGRQTEFSESVLACGADSETDSVSIRENRTTGDGKNSADTEPASHGDYFTTEQFPEMQIENQPNGLEIVRISTEKYEIVSRSVPIMMDGNYFFLAPTDTRAIEVTEHLTGRRWSFSVPNYNDIYAACNGSTLIVYGFQSELLCLYSISGRKLFEVHEDGLNYGCSPSATPSPDSRYWIVSSDAGMFLLSNSGQLLWRESGVRLHTFCYFPTNENVVMLSTGSGCICQFDVNKTFFRRTRIGGLGRRDAIPLTDSKLLYFGQNVIGVYNCDKMDTEWEMDRKEEAPYHNYQMVSFDTESRTIHAMIETSEQGKNGFEDVYEYECWGIEGDLIKKQSRLTREEAMALCNN